MFVVASSGGQFVAAALFLSSGNQWNVSKLALVILVGMIIALVPAGASCLRGVSRVARKCLDAFSRG